MKIEGEAPPVPTEAEMQTMWNEEAATRAGDDPPAESESTDPETTDESTSTAVSEPEAPAAAPAAQPTFEERYAKLEKLVEDLGGVARSTAGRVSSMQSRFDAAEAARKATSEAPTKTAIAQAQGDLKKWNALREDFPEWAEAMEERLASLAPTQAPSAPSIDKEALKAELRREMEQDSIAEKYPDWRATAQTREFQNWFNTQPAEFRAKAESDKGRDVIQVLDKFNEAKTKSVTDIRQSRQNKLDAAAGVATPGRPAPRVKDESEMTAEEIWNQEARRLAAKRKAG